MIDIKQIRKDFPIFKNHPSLTYLDSAATSLKPKSVISKITEYYERYSANIHRGIYQLSEKASEEYERTRAVVALFINAPSSSEIIFTRNATEGINVIASTIGVTNVSEGDEIVTTVMEHHANFVPWQQLAFDVGADFKVIDIDENGSLPLKVKGHNSKSKTLVEISDIISKKTKILAIGLVSNTLGTINPVKAIIAAAKKINPQIIAVVDAAQAVPHMKIDVQDLGCDFLVFSSHKMLGPTGVGVLWGRHEILKQMPPYQYGGDMIRTVALSDTTFADSPHRFEAGTPNISGVIGLKEAITYLENVGLDSIRKHEHALTKYAMEKLTDTFKECITIFGPADPEKRAGLISFQIKGVHPHDIAQILDEHDIAVRAGHHCTMPLHTRLDVAATTRASFYIYNDVQDIDKLIDGLKIATKIFSNKS